MLLQKYRPEPYHEDFVRSESFAQTAPKVGVLLINLGTPDAPEPAAIRRYLAQFLSDPRVVELPPILWQPILRTAVLRSEEHTSELQSRGHLVCRLLLEKKKITNYAACTAYAVCQS